MDLLLLERSNIMNIMILLNLIAYYLYCKRSQKTTSTYLAVVGTILGHVVFGLLTEITVNVDSVPKAINDSCHIMFLTFSILFTAEFFRYILALIAPSKTIKKYMAVAYFVAIIGIVSLFLTDIEYKEGTATNYSAGIGVTICFAIVFLMFIVTNVVMIMNAKRIEKDIIFTILPISFISISFMCVQIIIPEFLFTENALTLLALNSFFALENPVKRMKERAYIDYNTGVYNRNCFENDSDLFRKMSNQKFACLMCDINYLKQTNDTYGHMEGDNLISLAADILQASLKGAFKIYRIGGDEFVAIYKDNNIAKLEEEAAEVKKKCSIMNKLNTVPIELAIGWSELLEGESYDDMIIRADKNMYDNKKELKKNKN